MRGWEVEGPESLIVSCGELTSQHSWGENGGITAGILCWWDTCQRHLEMEEGMWNSFNPPRAMWASAFRTPDATMLKNTFISSHLLSGLSRVRVLEDSVQLKSSVLFFLEGNRRPHSVAQATVSY